MSEDPAPEIVPSGTGLILYLGASWIVIEVCSELQDSLTLPHWLRPVTIIFLLIGSGGGSCTG
jgi:hypothetical protein